MTLSKSVFFILSFFLIALQTSMSGMEIGIFVLFILFLYACLKEKRNLLIDFPLKVPFIYFSVIVGIGILLGSASTNEKLRDLLRIRFFFWCAILWVFLGPFFFRRRWLRPMVVTSVIVGVYSFFQHFYSFDFLRPEGKKVLLFAIPEGKIGPLVVGFFNHHLTFANIFLFYACIYFALRKHYKFLGWLGGFFFLLVAWTESRMAWISLLLTAVFFLWGKKWKVWVASVLVSLAIVGGFLATDSGFKGRLDQVLYRKDTTESVQDRVKLWKMNWLVFKENPWFGLGWNNNEREARKYYARLFPEVAKPFVGHAHSEFLQVLSSTGLLGLLGYLWIWVALFAQIFKARREHAPGSFESDLLKGLLIAFMGFHVQGVTQWNFGDAEVLYNVVFFWALSLATVKPKGSPFYLYGAS